MRSSYSIFFLFAVMATVDSCSAQSSSPAVAVAAASFVATTSCVAAAGATALTAD